MTMQSKKSVSETQRAGRAMALSGRSIVSGSLLLGGLLAACSAPAPDRSNDIGEASDPSDGSGGASTSGGSGGFANSASGGFTSVGSGGGPATGAGGGAIVGSGGTGGTGGTGTDCGGVTCQNGASCDDAAMPATCTCTDGWTGADCSTADCTGVSCAGDGTGTCDNSSGLSCICDAGFQDNDEDLSCDAACATDTCGEFEVCDDSTGAATCACAPGYTGADCLTCDTANFYEEANGGPGAGGTCERPSCLADGAYSFLDDFTDSDACWVSDGGTWTIVADGVSGSEGYQQGSTASENVFTVAHPGPFTNVRVSARVKVLSWNGTNSKNDYVGVFARYADSSESYGAAITSGNFLLTTEDVSQKGSSLRVRENSDGQMPTDVWYTLTFEVTGTDPSALVATFHDGTAEHVQENTSNASSLGPGYIALGTSSGITAVFDDVTVTVLD